MKRVYQKGKTPTIFKGVSLILIVLGSVGVIASLLFLFTIRMPERITFVVASIPIQVVTVNTAEHTATIVKIPEEFSIKSAYAMGTYSLSSLWKMGGLDSKDSSLLSESIQVSLGIPVDGYIGISHTTLFDQQDSSNVLKDQFTILGILQFALHHRVTDMSFLKLIHLYKSVKSMRHSDIKIVDLGTSMSTIDDLLPDGSIQQQIDPERTDMILKNVYVHPEIRKEALTLGVSNAAGIPELAANISRQLTHTGMFVVRVTSDEAVQQDCLLTGNNTVLESKTAHFLTEKFHCKPKVSEVSQREDLIMHIGTTIGSLYIPKGKK